MDDDSGCKVWRQLANFKSNGEKRFLVVASDGFRDSLRIRQEVGSHPRTMISLSKPVTLETPNGRLYPVEVKEELGDIVLRSGWKEFVKANHIEEDYSILFVSSGNSIFKVHIFDSSGHEKSSCSQPPFGVFGAAPPCDHYVLNEQVVPDPGHVQTSSDIIYTTLPGCRLTEGQHKNVLEIADTMEFEIPLHVAVMDKNNSNLMDSFIYMPLLLVLNHFKDEITKVTIQLEAPDNYIYSVGARRHSYDLVVLDSAWDSFVASQCIQEKDLLIFRNTQKSHLEVLILDPSGREKTPSNFVMGNSSSTQETSGDSSVQIVDPPPPEIFDMSSSDEDYITSESMRESCRLQERVTPSSAKTPSNFVMGSSSSTQETSGDSLEIVDPPPREIFDMSSSDDDDITIEAMRESCRGQKRVARSSVKARKMASSSSPCTKSGDMSSSDDDDITIEAMRESCRVQKRVARSSVKARKMASSSSPCTKSGYKTHDGAPVKLGVGSEPPSSNLGGTYILGSKATLSLQMEKKVEEKVQAIGSELPIFVKEMSSSNVDGVGCGTCEMAFCVEYGSTCLPDEKRTLFLQVEGKGVMWETTFNFRSDKMRRIFKGWREFSTHNALEVGDVCLFKLEDRDASVLKMAVYVIRKSQTEP